MAAVGARVSVTDAATQVSSATDADSVAGHSLVVKNAGATACDLGGAGVTAGAGFELAAGASVSMDLLPGDVLYARCASAQTTTLHVLRLGV